MIQLHFGNDLSQFMESIHKQYITQAKKSWTQSMSTPTLIAGTPLIQRWLNLKLCEENGILMGLKINRLENSIWDILVTDESKPLNVNTLEPILLKIIQDKLSEVHHLGTKENDFEWGELYRYLYKDECIETEKWVQLSKNWARSFLEYELNRPAAGNDPGMLATWSKGQKYFKAKQDTDKVEKTQMALWKCISYELENNHPHLKSLPMVWAENQVQNFPLLNNLSSPPTWIVIGLPGLSHFHRNALMELGQKINIHIYLLNPCAEFWEDMSTGHTKRKLSQIPKLTSQDYSKENLFDYDPNLQEDQKLLELWGAADRENLLLWGQVGDDLEFDKKPIQNMNTRLHLLQHLIINRINEAESKIPHTEITDDSSLFLVKAPTAIREMETLRDLALGMMDPKHPLHTPGIHASDFCLLLPDLGAYQIALEQSFLQGSSMDRLPVFILKGLGKSSLVSSLLLQYVDLLQSGFQRAKVFKFLQNELVLAKLKMDRALLADWERWAAELNLYRGFNEKHRMELRDHEPIDIHTWQYAFDRIVAGWLGLSPLEIGDKQFYPWKSSILDDKQNMAKMIADVTALYESLAKIQKYLDSNASFDKKMIVEECSQWIDLNQLDHKEEQIWEQWLNTLDGLEIQGQVDLELFCTWSKHHLADELDADLLKHTGSMVIAPLRMGHILPHKIIFVGGLGADFPGQVQKSSMDLLKHHRILGDMDPIKNAQGSFLHTILSAQDKLILSYTSQNIQKDEILYPSSVITELDTYLKNSISSDPTQGLPILEARLLTRDPQNLHSNSITYTYDKSLLEALSFEELNLTSQNQIWRDGEVNLKDLAEFLKSPIDYRLKKGLGLYEEESKDSTRIEDEPLHWDPLTQGMHLKVFALNVFNFFTQKHPFISTELNFDEIESLIESHFHTLRIQGDLAESYFAEDQKQILREFGQQCISQLRALAESFPNYQWIGPDDEFWSKYFPESNDFSLDNQHHTRLSSIIPEYAIVDPSVQNVVIVQITGSKIATDKLLLPWLQSLWLKMNFTGTVHYLQIGKSDQLEIFTSDQCKEDTLDHLQQIIIEERSRLHSPISQHIPLVDSWDLLLKGELTSSQLTEKLEGDYSRYYPMDALNLIQPMIPENVHRILLNRLKGFAQSMTTKEEAND